MQAAKTILIHPPPTVRSERTDSSPKMAYWLERDQAAATANVLTVDLEDWPVAVLGPEHDVTGRVVESTLRCLQVLRWHNVKATFFVLGKVAEKYGDLVREVRAAGHEIASHGYGHKLLFHQTPQEFEEDVRRSVGILARLTGESPVGYRAPGFSIVESTRWAGPILARLGFEYSSSIFPIPHRRYGIADAPRGVHRWSDCPLIECPPATFRALGRNWPVAGGGYFRLLPGMVARAAIRRVNRSGMPAILYLHPYELDAGGVAAHKLAGIKVTPWRHLTQELFRGRMEGRLHRLLEEFRFTTMRGLLRRFTSGESSG